ncbi:unnamed protein product [Colias eurytheme]|nr:unnamed protein product [Colias eurytheme]
MVPWRGSGLLRHVLRFLRMLPVLKMRSPQMTESLLMNLYQALLEEPVLLRIKQRRTGTSSSQERPC